MVKLLISQKIAFNLLYQHFQDISLQEDPHDIKKGLLQNVHSVYRNEFNLESNLLSVGWFQSATLELSESVKRDEYYDRWTEWLAE